MYLILSRRHCIDNSNAILVGKVELHRVDKLKVFIIADCGLDIEWLSEDSFASCGADKLIHIMRLDEGKPIKTLT